MSISLNFKASIQSIEETKQVTEKLKTRDFVVEIKNIEKPQFTDTFKMQLINDGVVLIDAYKIGDELNFFCNLLGRKQEKDGKTSFFPTLQVWKIERVAETAGAN